MQALKRASKPYKREVAWDIEAIHWSEVICVTGVSSDGESIIAHSLSEYLQKAAAKGWLTADTRHWSHYGGIYDNLLAWEHCAGRWLLREARAGTGFGLWSAEFERGSHIWVLRDSARVMPQSLASVGKAFGWPKLEIDRSNLGLYSQAEVDRYCLNDSEVLLHAVTKFSEFVEESGSVLRDTIASSAATIIRLNHLPNDVWGWNASLDTIAAKAYYGGRVERYTSELGPGRVYDINSSYPAAMLRPLPTRFVGAGQPRKGHWYFAHAEVSVPDKLHIPPLPYRGELAPRFEGKLLFPSGKWEGYYAREEIEAAREAGCKVVELCAWNYQTADWLAPIMQKWWEVRAATDDPGTKYITKILMNAVSGKLIEWGEYERIIEDPREADEAHAAGERVKVYPMRTKSGETITYYGITEKRTGVLRHAAAAASVLSQARAALYRGMTVAQKSGVVAYCDTDSVITDGTMASSKELGAFKHERDFECAEFLAPKLYALGQGDDVAIKAKGFRVPRFRRHNDGTTEGRDPREVWARLSFGAPLVSEGTLGFARQLGSRRVHFERVDLYRQRHSNIDKRRFEGSNSRAWSVNELRAEETPS